jgi:hypothetical protein
MRHAPFRRLGLYAWPAQILLYLHPLDLLRIYRTCSSLRSVIISPATRFLWDVSFSSVPNMPPCPSHLTQMFYAHLSFEHRCHVGAFLSSYNLLSHAQFCGAHATTVVWKLWTRICARCVDTEGTQYVRRFLLRKPS